MVKYLDNHERCNGLLLGRMYTICSMGVDTIGEALSLGWRVVARYARRARMALRRDAVASAVCRRELDIETLACTRAGRFCCRGWNVGGCPRCGNGRMVMFEPPELFRRRNLNLTEPAPQRALRSRCYPRGHGRLGAIAGCRTHPNSRDDTPVRSCRRGRPFRTRLSLLHQKPAHR